MHNIEQLKKRDIESYIELIDSCFGYKTSYRDIVKMMKKSKIIVIKDHNEVVATLTISILHDYIKRIKKYHLDYVCVKETHRQQHLATKMFSYVYDLAKQEHIDCIELTSNPNRKEANLLYEKEGFNKRATNLFTKKKNS